MEDRALVTQEQNEEIKQPMVDIEEDNSAFNDNMLSVVQDELLRTIDMIDDELNKIEGVLQLANKVSPGLYSVKSSLLGLRIDALKKIGDFVFDKKKMGEDDLGDVKDITDLLGKVTKT